MTLKTSKLRDAIAFALVAGIAAPGIAFAQEEGEQEQATTLDRIQVTGSRIKRVDAESSQPIEVISREQIEQTGLNNVYEILNNITASDGSGLSTVTTQTNGSDGSQQISLRGLGADRTLVLVDGKRWATDIDQTVDLSTIPLAIVERIEVLKDGASAIYGSDAVAGVVNIITRKEFDGAQLGLYFGQTAKGDGDRTGIDVTIGASGERSRGVMSLSRTTQDEIFAGDREISKYPYYGCEQLAQHPDYNTLGTAVGSYFGAFCGSGFPAYGNFSTSGGAMALIPGEDGQDVSDYRPFRNRDRYNFAPVNYLQQPAERKNIFVSGSFDLTDNISAFARANYTNRTSTQQLAQVPVTAATNGSRGPQWTIGIDANSVFNPFGENINTWGHRSVAIGPRSPSYDYNILTGTAGLEGSFNWADRGFDWEVFAQYNKGNYDSTGTGYLNLFNLRRAVGPSFRDGSGVLRCGTPGNVIANCVPYNVFGGPDLGLAAGVITQEEYDAMVNYVGYTQVSTAGNTGRNFGANISGDLFSLPGGMAGFALGVESRRDEAFNQPDALVAGGGSSDNFSEPTRGQTKVEEVFAEVVLPLLRDVPGAQELELSAAIRKSNYSASGFVGSEFLTTDPGEPTNQKYGLRWKPFDDLLVRASWGETFRAPSAFDLYGGGGESFPSVQDPCNSGNFGALSPDAQARCMADGVPPGGAPQLNSQLRSLIGGNPFLQPEFGENTSVGFVYSPSWFEGFDIAVDYWKVELTDAQSLFSAGAILNNCYVNGDPQFCGFVSRAPNGEVSLIRQTRFNASSFETDGVDVGIGYRMNTDGFGSFRFQWDTTWVNKYEFNGNDFIGDYNGTPNWEYRSVLTTNWAMGDWDASWNIRHMSELEEGCFIMCNDPDALAWEDLSTFPGDVLDRFDQTNRIGSVTYHDLQVGWRAPWNAKVAVGARNIFGKEPPYTNNAFAHSFDAAYDLPGGPFYYMQYRQDF